MRYLFLAFSMWLAGSFLFGAQKNPESKNYPIQICPPNPLTIQLVKEVKPKVYAEIGISVGGTVLEVSKLLPPDGEIHLFDFYNKVAVIKDQLLASGFKNVVGHSNSYKLRDSYNWSLMKLLQSCPEPIFDYVYIDGSHTWEIDGFTFFLVDKLLKPGGYIDFDDYHWSLGTSPTMKPSLFPLTAKLYTEEQINTQHIKLVVDLLVRPHPNYIEVSKNKVFQKAFK